jgi:hypothetical protein
MGRSGTTPCGEVWFLILSGDAMNSLRLLGQWWILGVLMIGCSSTAYPPPGLYSVKETDLLSYLSRSGLLGHGLHDYWQDSQGRTVYVSEELTGETEHKVFVLRADRTEPLVVRWPAWNPIRRCWINPDGEVIYLPNYGLNEYHAEIYTVVDAQSGYFFQHNQKTNVIYVGHMANKEGWLTTIAVKDDFAPVQVVGTESVFYLIDAKDRETPPWGYWLLTRKNCWKFSRNPKDPSHFVKVDELTLPGMVDCLDPTGTIFLCAGYGSPPFFGSPFLYDVKAHRMDNSMSLDDYLPVLLQGNWLHKRIDN